MPCWCIASAHENTSTHVTHGRAVGLISAARSRLLCLDGSCLHGNISASVVPPGNRAETFLLLSRRDELWATLNRATSLDPGSVATGRPEATQLSNRSGKRIHRFFMKNICIYSQMQNLKVKFKITALPLEKWSAYISQQRSRQCFKQRQCVCWN